MRKRLYSLITTTDRAASVAFTVTLEPGLHFRRQGGQQTTEFLGFIIRDVSEGDLESYID